MFPGVGFVAAGGTFRQRQNVDAVKVRGIEASAEWTRGPWSVRAGASLTHARMRGQRRGGVPRRAAAGANARSSPRRWPAAGNGTGRARSSCCAASARSSRTTSTRARLKGATTLDASASWPLTDRLQLVARGENITNALVMAAINGDGSIERATPRTLWIGLRMR